MVRRFFVSPAPVRHSLRSAAFSYSSQPWRRIFDARRSAALTQPQQPPSEQRSDASSASVTTMVAPPPVMLVMHFTRNFLMMAAPMANVKPTVVVPRRSLDDAPEGRSSSVPGGGRDPARREPPTRPPSPVAPSPPAMDPLYNPTRVGHELPFPPLNHPPGDKTAMVHSIRQLADHDPSFFLRLLDSVNAETRRSLVLTAAALGEPSSTLKVTTAAVPPASTPVSERSSDRQLHSLLSKLLPPPTRGAAAAVSSATALHMTNVPWRSLAVVAIQSGGPFIAFGFLDNTLMLLAGDRIDALFGAALHLSVLGAAALGGVVSGAIGIQSHGLVERGTHRLLARHGATAAAALSPQQERTRLVIRTRQLARSVGIIVGLMMGMWPLLMSDHHRHHSESVTTIPVAAM